MVTLLSDLKYRFWASFVQSPINVRRNFLDTNIDGRKSFKICAQNHTYFHHILLHTCKTLKVYYRQVIKKHKKKKKQAIEVHTIARVQMLKGSNQNTNIPYP